MSTAKVLLIGRTQVKGVSFPASLQKRYDLTIVPNGKRAQELAAQDHPHVIILDAVSLRTPGDRICRSLRQHCPSTPIIHIHPGPRKAVDSPADEVLVPKFTSRKLINSIERLITLSDDKIIAMRSLQPEYGPPHTGHTLAGNPAYAQSRPVDGGVHAASRPDAEP